MDRLEMAIELIRRAQNESKRMMKYESEINAVRKRPDYTFKLRYEVDLKFSPLPHKSVINDSLKMARQLLKEEYV